MRSFTDTKGGQWVIDINYVTIGRVKDQAGVDLTQILQPQSKTDEQLADVLTFLKVLETILQPQLDARQITFEQMAERMDEESGEAAVLAIYQGTIDFFRPQKREALATAFQRFVNAGKRKRDRAAERMTQILSSPAFDQAVEMALDGKDSAADSRPLSASTPET